MSSLSIDKYLLSTNYVDGTVLGTLDRALVTRGNINHRNLYCGELQGKIIGKNDGSITEARDL